jgi:hypothetical protein
MVNKDSKLGVENTNSLKRYTELPFVLQILQSKSISLLNANSWDDKNDAHYVECYRKKSKLKSVLALCLTEASQTYHHWRIFSQGASGACIYFKRPDFLKWVSETAGLEGKKVLYKNIKQLTEEVGNGKIELADIPYIKRKAYQNEAEFRLIFESDKLKKIKTFPLPLSIIDRVVLNPWLPPSTVASLKLLIGKIDGCENIPVFRATIVQNDEWRKLADAIKI